VLGIGVRLAREEVAVIDFLRKQSRRKSPTLAKALEKSIGRTKRARDGKTKRAV
jgi:hypothetical protein